MSKPTKATALYDFDGEQGSEEMTLTTGERLVLTDMAGDDGWWAGYRESDPDQVEGIFPAAYVMIEQSSDSGSADGNSPKPSAGPSSPATRAQQPPAVSPRGADPHATLSPSSPGPRAAPSRAPVSPNDTTSTSNPLAIDIADPKIAPGSPAAKESPHTSHLLREAQPSPTAAILAGDGLALSPGLPGPLLSPTNSAAARSSSRSSQRPLEKATSLLSAAVASSAARASSPMAGRASPAARAGPVDPESQEDSSAGELAPFQWQDNDNAGGGGVGPGGDAETGDDLHAALLERDTSVSVIEPPPETPLSTYSVWAHAMAVSVAYLLLLVGFLVFIVYFLDDEFPNRGMRMFAAWYSWLLGALILRLDAPRASQGECLAAVPVLGRLSRMPLRPLLYVAGSVLLFLTEITAIIGLMMLAVALAYGVALARGEDPTRELAPVLSSVHHKSTQDDRSGGKDEPPSPLRDSPTTTPLGFLAWLLMAWRRRRRGVLLAVLVWLSVSVVIFFSVLGYYMTCSVEDQPACGLSGWTPVAEALEAVVDLNLALLMASMCRVFFAWVQDIGSRPDSRRGTVVARVLFGWLAPTDLGPLHVLFAGSVLVLGVAHAGAEVLTWGLHRLQFRELYGAAPWITGAMMSLALLLLFTLSQSNVRFASYTLWSRGHFWASLMFFLFLLMHGRNWWARNLWKWLLAPFALKLFDWALDVQAYQWPFVPIKSITLIGGDSGETPGPLAGGLAADAAAGGKSRASDGGSGGGLLVEVLPPCDYEEGQTFRMKFPHVCSRQWVELHALGSPSSETLFFFIPVSRDPRSWAYRLRDYVALLATHNDPIVYFGLASAHPAGPNGSPGYASPTRTPRGTIEQVPHQVLLEGPHAAPTQRVVDYESVLIVTTASFEQQSVQSNASLPRCEPSAHPSLQTLASACSALESILLHRWAQGLLPERVQFVVLVEHRDVAKLQWLWHRLKILDDVAQAIANPQLSAGRSGALSPGGDDAAALHASSKYFSVHIFVLNVPFHDELPRRVQIDQDNTCFRDIAAHALVRPLATDSSWSANDLYTAVSAPVNHRELGRAKAVHVWSGGPNWRQTVSAPSLLGKVGVICACSDAITAELQPVCQDVAVETQREYVLHSFTNPQLPTDHLL